MLEDFLEKANSAHNNFYDYSLVEYKNNKIKVKIICPIHGTFEQIPKSHTSGQGCPKCATLYKAKNLTKNIDYFLNQVNIKHNNFFSYDRINYINNKTDIIVTCPIHGDFTVNPSHHLNGTGCSKCSKTYRKNTEEFISKAITVHFGRYDYSLTIFKNNKTKIKIICSKHGEFEQRPEHHLLGCNCPKCNSSKGEIEIRKYLEVYNIKFIEQQRFNECRNKKPLPFDFFLPEYNICIEYDGIQHYMPIRGDKFLQTVIKHDNIKNKFCKNKNIELIRIPYTENDLESIIKTIKNKIMT